MPSKTLYPSVYLPRTASASVFLRAGADVVAMKFSKPLIKPKITNWRISEISEGFQFVDGTDFDFVDGTPLDFVDA